jgi:nucleotide-binding universal stress UspA family protein
MYRAILVPLDGSTFAEHALPVAVSIAKALHAKMSIVRAWDPSNYRFGSEMPPPYLDAEAHDRLVAGEYLDAVAARLRSTDGIDVDVAVVAGRPADSIRERAVAIGADLIVMTTHGLTGWSRAWLGSVADAVVREVVTPVLLCRPAETPRSKSPGTFEHILIPLDGSAAAEQILAHAAELGRIGGARYTLLRIVQSVKAPVHPYAYAAPAWQTDQAATEDAVSHATSHLAAAAEQLKARCPGASVELDVRLDERTGTAIVDAAREHQADLVALTTHVRRGMRVVLGSAADKVLRGTDGAVLVLHPTDRA